MVTASLVHSIAVGSKVSSFSSSPFSLSLTLHPPLQAAPHAKLDDGAIDIVYTTDDASKVDLAGYLLSLFAFCDIFLKLIPRQLTSFFPSLSSPFSYFHRDSEEVDLSCVRYRKAKAFMLESCSDKGRFALDGELTSYEPIRYESFSQFSLCYTLICFRMNVF